MTIIISQKGALRRWIEISELDTKFGGEAAFINIARGAADPPKLGRAFKQLRDFVLNGFQFVEAEPGVRDDKNITGHTMLIY